MIERRRISKVSVGAAYGVYGYQDSARQKI